MATVTMERVQKLLEVHRVSFDKLFNEIVKHLESKNSDISIIQGNFSTLFSKNDKLNELNKNMLDYMIDSDCLPQDIDSEIELADSYLSKFHTINCRIDQLLTTDRLGSLSIKSQTKSNLKYPKIEFKKFGGDLIDWLPFWNQFKRIDEDDNVDPQDKFQFLLQATIPKSRARQIVESYPATAQNYYKALESLKSRYGKDELLVEFYVRELLQLVLGNLDCKTSLSNLYDKLEAQLRALETLNVTSDKYVAMLFPLVESSLPEDILRVWQRSLSSLDTESTIKYQDNKLNKLMDFLRREVENEEKINLAVSGFQCIRKKKENISEPTIPTATGLINHKSSFQRPAKCVFCKNIDHTSDKCKTALEISFEKRKKILSENGRCFICTRYGHSAQRCHVNIKCEKCMKRHATILCIHTSRNEAETSPTLTEEIKTDSTVQSYSNVTYNEVFLQTFVAKIIGNDGLTKVVRCIIDTGSQRSYINKFVAEELKLQPLGEENLIHALFGGTESETVVHKSYRIELHHLSNQFACTFQVLDQSIICSNVVSVSSGPWIAELINVGISINDTKPGPIDVLIGADVAAKLVTGRRHALQCGLVAIECQLGWSLMGKAHIRSNDLICTASMLTTSLFCQDENVSNLWTLDVLGITDPAETKSRKDAELTVMKHFKDTVQINDKDRYEVVLPWVENHPSLPSNFTIAKKRLENLMVKFEKDGHYSDCDQVFQEWLREGIIERVPENEITNFGHYLPHRLVIKQQSTTKFRPVFDASAHEKNQPSLNQCLEKGTNFIEIIPSILLKFRLGKIGVMSDIKKAFLQISISKSDRDFLRFLWHDESGIIYFRHARVVFGLTCSPFHLGAVIQHHLDKEIDAISNGNSCFSKEMILKLQKSFYVDNCVTSLNTEDECSEFIVQSKAVMDKAKFDLRGWETTILKKEEIPGENFVSSVLGLKWNRFEDTLKLSFDWFETINFEKVTKRSILSLANKIFDPIGVTSPCSLFAKIMLQKMWSINIPWDSEIPNDQKSIFLEWAKELNLLINLKIPRWLLNSSEATHDTWTIHLFVDASLHAYSAVIFLRSESPTSGINTQLIQAKSTVAPLKKISIPRLELMAATIGARLLSSVLENLEIQNVSVFCWSDSSTVLFWIRQEYQWKTFVSNRVQEIRTLTKIENWHFVPGELNLADLPSRSCSPKKLLESEWWKGAICLRKSQDDWPKEKTEVNEQIVFEERKRNTSTLVNNKKNSNWYYFRFSKYQKILNLVAWILRFATNCKEKKNGKIKIDKVLILDEVNTKIKQTTLTLDEIEKSEKLIIRMIQEESFSNGKEDPILQSLQTFTDDEGILRLKTRITEREDTEYFRFPMILPSNHPVVKRMIEHHHRKLYHIGTQGLLCILREKFWIVRGRKTIKSVIHKCVICRRHEIKHYETPSSPLPRNRIADTAIFEVTGVDLTGPLYIRNNVKVWVCIFTCAVYRSVHLELVSSLSTDSFLQGLRKFISRRGRPKIIYSDNGTNFVGSENVLKNLDWNKINDFSNVERISWLFNPPTGAWWGGWWERLIRLLKQLLRKTLGRISLSYEELQTNLCECEALINSRPLTYVSEDKNDLIPLTPAMFLQDIQTVETKDLDEVDSSTLNRHLKYRLKLKEDLKKRFRSEYLSQLIMIQKSKETQSIQKGEVVLIGSEQKRLHWPLGLVLETYPGKDNKIRVVKLRTAIGTIVRPVQKLYPLEVTSAEDTAGLRGKVKLSEPKLKEKPEHSKLKEHRIKEEPEHETRQIVTRSGRKVEPPRRFR